MFRLYLKGVDITAIFAAHGWNRIPIQGSNPEWWHYEYHPDGISWTSAMLQVWPTATLQAAFPDINWAAIGCTGGAGIPQPGPGNTPQPAAPDAVCVVGVPTWSSTVEYIDGCGPAVRAGEQVYHLDTAIGFVGLTGLTTGPHLHLGLQVQRYDGSYGFTDVCTEHWLQGRQKPAGTLCYTDWADPQEFLPRAPAQAPNGVDGQPLVDGAPFQLPPPNYPNSLVLTPVPHATPVGQYWSPYADGGQYGGGGLSDWLKDSTCRVWNGFPWCP
jgi:hypothetical protein